MTSFHIIVILTMILGMFLFFKTYYDIVHKIGYDWKHLDRKKLISYQIVTIFLVILFITGVIMSFLSQWW